MQYIVQCDRVLWLFTSRSSALSYNPSRHVYIFFTLLPTRQCYNTLHIPVLSFYCGILNLCSKPVVYFPNSLKMSSENRSSRTAMNVRHCLADFSTNVQFCFIVSNPSFLTSLLLLFLGIFSSSGSHYSTNSWICPTIWFTSSFMVLPKVCAYLLQRFPLRVSGSRNNSTTATIHASSCGSDKLYPFINYFLFHLEYISRNHGTPHTSKNFGTSFSFHSFWFCFHLFRPWTVPFLHLCPHRMILHTI